MEVEHHPHRVRGGVDRRQEAVDLILEPVEVRLLGGAEVAKRFGFEADTLEDGLLVPDPAPHRRDPGTGLPQRRPRHASAVALRPCRDKGVQPHLDLVERVEGGGEYCAEHRLDDVSLAPSRREIGSEDRRQRDSLVVQRQQVVVRNEDLNRHGPQAVPGLLLLRLTLDIAAKREGDGLSVSVEGARGVAVASAPQST